MKDASATAAPATSCDGMREAGDIIVVSSGIVVKRPSETIGLPNPGRVALTGSDAGVTHKSAVRSPGLPGRKAALTLRQIPLTPLRIAG